MTTIRIILFLLFTCAFSFSKAQNIYVIDLTKKEINISTKQIDFYINEVIDSREDKTLGFVLAGRKDNLEIAEISGGFQKGIKDILKSSFPSSNNLKAVSIEITSAKIKETILHTGQSAKAEIHINVIYKDSVIFTTSAIHERQASDATGFHAENLVITLAKCIENYANNIVPGPNADTSEAKVPSAEENKNRKGSQNTRPRDYENRDIVAIGYQIGGLTLIGIDYTLRLTNVFGIHAGAGYAGYTFGIRFHLTPDRNSTFINASFKDGGFGLINTIGAEYGGRLPFGSGSRFGFHYQGGLAFISYIDSVFEQQLFPNSKAPKYILSIGLGVSF